MSSPESSLSLEYPVQDGVLASRRARQGLRRGSDRGSQRYRFVAERVLAPATWSVDRNGGDMTAQNRVVAGRARTAGGSAIAGARIYFLAGPGPLPDVAALTDGTGAFSLSVPYAGPYTIGCSAEGYVSETLDVPVIESSGRSIEFVMKRLKA